MEEEIKVINQEDYEAKLVSDLIESVENYSPPKVNKHDKMCYRCEWEGMREVKVTPTYSIFINREYVYREILDAKPDIKEVRNMYHAETVKVTVYTVQDGIKEKIHEVTYDKFKDQKLFDLMRNGFITQVTGQVLEEVAKI